ncbi:hypothetical protein BCL57_000796 [Agromyces flavus]|uniref:Uncharacterized protein n=1 Tax=Agromyces flavus TaxID=589382 RepID=A0A1H1YDK9_9MICO|nr:hypothetical protein [Agromyces flavus]MCP2366654.1 hypothetical protein [Agromyces flavus]GGI45108.1 hypothetical protein GCM10010932_07970 [Agromyces flavus]SDT19471.1 hypothetical protein SAMN04489721_2729 [Agromyces flavus]
MSNAERIAELQRVVYGAGASDDERAAAVDELEGLRPALSRAEAADSRSAGAAPDVETTTVGSPTADPNPDLDADAEDLAGSRSTTLQWAALAGAVALAVGVGIGWLFGVQTAATLTPGAAPAAAPDDDVTFELAPAQPAEPTSLEDAPAMAVFERAQVPEDLPSSTHPEIDPSSYRRIATLPDGASVHAAHQDDANQICLHVERPDHGASSMCMAERDFATDGMTLDSEIGGMSYRISWQPSGALSLSSSPAN